MDSKFTVEDIRILQPSLKVEKEIYIIEQEASKLYLEVYLNTDYGFEYELYDQDYDQIDGGVVDHVDYENDDIVVDLIVALLDELGIKGNNITKMPETEISGFEAHADLMWRKKVETLKREFKLLDKERK